MPKILKETSSENKKSKESGQSKPPRKIPVRIGDTNNTIIYIREGEDAELAKQYFLSRLDPYNPARSKLTKQPKKKKNDEEAIKEKAALSYLEQKKRNRDRLTFVGFDF